jgi:integrase
MEAELKVRGSVTFLATVSEGKVVAKRGPYTVPTVIPKEHAILVLKYLRKALGPNPAPNARLFESDKNKPNSVSHNHQLKLMRQALRISNPTIGTRAIRRGSLQAMAEAGVEHETLMTFSGHTSVNTLLRYLNWGRKSNQQVNNAQAVAHHLDPTTHQATTTTTASQQTTHLLTQDPSSQL